MAPMSSCSNVNWGTLENPNLEMTTFLHGQAQVLATDVFTNYCSDGLDFIPDTFIDPLFFSDELLLYPENQNHTYLLPYFTSPCDPLLLTHPDPPQVFPQQHFHSYPNPAKRQKYCNENLYHSSFTPTNYFDGFVSNSSPVLGISSPDLLISTPLPEFEIRPQANFSENNANEIYERKREDACVSAQSIAARQRRRKITEKTQELGELIPGGGNKMNTAQMLQAAFNYVEFLQAQVGVLQLMVSIQESKGTTHIMEELQVLASSSVVQEKLYLEEKCLIPTEFVKILTNHPDFKSRPSLSNDLHQLIQSKDS